MIDVPYRTVVGPEILSQHDSEFILVIFLTESFIQILEYLGFCLTELVYTLLYVAYSEYVVRRVYPQPVRGVETNEPQQ